MKQMTYEEFVRILRKNGFELNRKKGSHNIFTNAEGIHISVPIRLKSVIALRLLKEHKLLL